MIPDRQKVWMYGGRQSYFLLIMTVDKIMRASCRSQVYDMIICIVFSAAILNAFHYYLLTHVT